MIDSTPAARISLPVAPKNSKLTPPGAHSLSARTSEAACASPEASPATIIRRKFPEASPTFIAGDNSNWRATNNS
jgi:hypothetical protein